MRHTYMRYLPVAALALGVGACSDDSGTDTSSVQGVSDTEIVVGTHQDLSGPIVSWGASIRNGMVMAIDEANALGGVHGRRIRLVVEDTGYEPRRAVLAVRKLVDRDKVFAVLGAIGSPTVLASQPIVLRKGILHLFPFTAAEGTYLPFHKLKFATNTPYKDSVEAGTAYMMEKSGTTRIGILYQDDDFGIDVRRGAERALKKRGLEPVSITTYKRGATDFSAQIARMRADGAELLVLGTVTRETIGAMQAARALGWTPPVLCSQACYTPEVPRLGGSVVEGIYATGQFPIPYADSPNPKVRAWLKTYNARFPIEANVQAISGYAITRLFVEALKKTGPNPTQASFARALEDMPSWVDPDVGGTPIDFTRTDHLGVREVFIAQIKDGRWVPVSDLIGGGARGRRYQ